MRTAFRKVRRGIHRIAETLRPFWGRGLRKVVTCGLTMANQLKPRERKGSMSKAEYVEKFLAPAMIAAGTGIKKVEYRLNDAPHKSELVVGMMHYHEELVVWYNDYYYKTVNVGGDSPSGMFYDVVKQGIF